MEKDASAAASRDTLLHRKAANDQIRDSLQLIEQDMHLRETKLQARHAQEWTSLQEHIDMLKQALPAAPAAQLPPGGLSRQTMYAAQTADKLRLERTLARQQKYETAHVVRQQIKADEISAYDQLMA